MIIAVMMMMMMLMGRVANETASERHPSDFVRRKIESH